MFSALYLFEPCVDSINAGSFTVCLAATLPFQSTRGEALMLSCNSWYTIASSAFDVNLL